MSEGDGFRHGSTDVRGHVRTSDQLPVFDSHVISLGSPDATRESPPGPRFWRVPARTFTRVDSATSLCKSCRRRWCAPVRFGQARDCTQSAGELDGDKLARAAYCAPFLLPRQPSAKANEAHQPPAHYRPSCDVFTFLCFTFLSRSSSLSNVQYQF